MMVSPQTDSTILLHTSEEIFCHVIVWIQRELFYRCLVELDSGCCVAGSDLSWFKDQCELGKYTTVSS